VTPLEQLNCGRTRLRELQDDFHELAVSVYHERYDRAIDEAVIERAADPRRVVALSSGVHAPTLGRSGLIILLAEHGKRARLIPIGRIAVIERAAKSGAHSSGQRGASAEAVLAAHRGGQSKIVREVHSPTAAAIAFSC
jgi:hypothetical protein